MDNDTLRRITELTQIIADLPKGTITEKVIKGKVYYYHQWSEGGKTKSVYVPETELAELSAKIETRKRLKDELNDLKWRGFSARQQPDRLGYVLMHLDRPVIELSFDEQSGVVLEIGKALDESLLPVGTTTSYGKVDVNRLKNWWAFRSIPASRSGIKEALGSIGIATTTALLTKGYGLSLSDGYWVKPTGSDVSWADVNFYDNPFSEDLGELLFTGAKKGQINLSSPDSTSVGNLKKRWKIIDGVRTLIKGGSAPFRQEPFNEALVSLICDSLEFEHVHYDLVFIDGYPYSLCPDFATPYKEFVPAEAIAAIFPKARNESSFDRFVRAGDSLGIPGVREFLSRMVVLDYIIANEDRHLNNFGFLRDSRSLSWIGPAPLFDNGSSLGFDKLDSEIASNEGIVCKPFRNKHWEQLKLASPLPRLDVNALNALPDMALSFFSERGGKFVDKERAAAIAKGVALRILKLKQSL